MKIRVIDFETSGTPEDEIKEICEIGWTDLLSDGTVAAPVSYLVDPGHPIPPQTRAIHHISDADVAGCMNPYQGRIRLGEDMAPDDVWAAHNAQFEQAFFGGGDRRWICTMRCAKHIYPEAPGYSNQTLRYWLGLDAEFSASELAMPPHRAGPDTFVTAYILRALLNMAPVDELVRLTSAPIRLVKVTFGKHKGKLWDDLPWDYLDWVARKSDLGTDEKHTARIILKEKY